MASVSTTTPGTDWEYAPAPESREIVTIQREYNLFIDGEFVPPATQSLRRLDVAVAVTRAAVVVGVVIAAVVLRDP